MNRWQLVFRRRWRRNRAVEVEAATLSAAIEVARDQHDLEGWRFHWSRMLTSAGGSDG